MYGTRGTGQLRGCCSRTAGGQAAVVEHFKGQWNRRDGADQQQRPADRPTLALGQVIGEQERWPAPARARVPANSIRSGSVNWAVRMMDSLG